MRNVLASIIFTAVLLVLPIQAASVKSKIVKQSLASQGEKRTYYLFVPKAVSASKPAPLVVMLHGSGRDGRILVEHWQNLAEREGIILAGPDARNSAGWLMPVDGPKFLYDLIEELKAKHPVNPQRVYLFGHSAGASFSIYMSLLESKYFAATAVHAGALRPDDNAYISRAERKIPMALFVGTNDPLFPLSAVRATRDMLKEHGFGVELTEIPKHDHNYYVRSKEINAVAWAFLQKHDLTGAAEYKEHRFR